ncbi:MAG: exopolyphosphatase, partial [Actinomycetales bacterium]
PLGELVHARSGDKGGDANVGLWVPAEHPRRDDAVAWLLGVVNPGWVQAMLPEASDLDVDVHPLPNLGGVNIVIHGLLGEGVSSSTRLDPQAKALGEWLRARVTAVPLTLLEGARP